MSALYDHGPLRAYEVTWQSGHVETIWAHQCILPMAGNPFLRDDADDSPRRVMFHGEIDGRWQLILAAPEAEIVTVRNLAAAPEPTP